MRLQWLGRPWGFGYWPVRGKTAIDIGPIRVHTSRAWKQTLWKDAIEAEPAKCVLCHEPPSDPGCGRGDCYRFSSGLGRR